jgi:hypothetical protein
VVALQAAREEVGLWAIAGAKAFRYVQAGGYQHSVGGLSGLVCLLWRCSCMLFFGHHEEAMMDFVLFGPSFFCLIY